MTSERPLHHKIWEREIAKFETFAECIVQFIGHEEEFWRLFDKADIWKRVFSCKILDHLDFVLCDHQVRYLNTLSKCLDTKLFRDFFRRIGVLDTYLEPIMTYLVTVHFDEPFDLWTGPAKLAFAIIYKIHTLDFEAQLAENLGQLNKRVEEVVKDVWKSNKALYEQKLSETLQIYWQLFGTSSEASIELKTSRSIVDCDDCLPLHDINYVIKCRSENMELIFRMAPDNDEQWLRRMRPFIVNLILPPIEDDVHALVSLVSMQNEVCPYNMARRLLQDRDLVKGWAKLILTYRPDSRSTFIGPIRMLLAVLGLNLGKRRTEVKHFNENDANLHWSLVEERIAWFGEAYNELVREDPIWTLESLIADQRLVNIPAVVVFSAILLYNGTLTEADQLKIIETAVSQFNDVVIWRGPRVAEEYRNFVALLQLCLHKEVCVRVMMLRSKNLSARSRTWIKPAYFTEEIVNLCAFRFLNSNTSNRVFQAAIHAVEVGFMHKTKFKRKMRAEFESRLEEVVESGGPNADTAKLELRESVCVTGMKADKKGVRKSKKTNRLAQSIRA